ncbi:MAG TPA: GNAT family N-acetyltransferase [Terracidiphilus sp.]|nr:GNAT family N-acetyltransferase [Terracidiphilus sp.]
MRTLEGVPLRLEPLGKVHDRESFHCGVDSLDVYLKTQASQEIRRRTNAVFVLTAENEPFSICGYFTLCSYGLEPGAIPEGAKKYLPRYPVISATLLGRLAVRKDLQGRRLGTILLSEALRKAYLNADVVGSSMVVVDAIDERAVRFYAAHGFLRFPESMRLVLPMRTLSKLLGEQESILPKGTS